MLVCALNLLLALYNMEHHPRLNFENLKITQEKIILGSFPTWSLSDLTNCSPEVIYEKSEIRKNKGEFPFFYGSSTNLFWRWYKLFVDLELECTNISAIITSLEQHKIGITDVIKSCDRKGRSALDHHLINRTYNQNFFVYPSLGGCLKILCTSKGVLNQMLLSKSFFKIHDRITIDNLASEEFELEHVKKLNGNGHLIKTPIFRKLNVLGGGTIECLAIPSPGSPYRSLGKFGLDSPDNLNYLNKYIKEAFGWFLV